jgi:glycosyltransferase involved in cell wall biosynthesis
LVVLSSKTAEQDFWRIFPESKAVTRVLSFHSLPSEGWLTLDPSETGQKYSLPDKFLICCNQFWIHKNHNLLFEAMVDVVRAAPDIRLVCTGSTSDWRFRDYFGQLTAFIEKHDLRNHISILGSIPRTDQIQLMRRSLAVIQPSLFEGWSSVVEEARMLGKTIILSDFAVHLEQAPDHAVYFDRNNAKDLAQKILDVLPHLSAGPDHIKEREAKKKSIDLVENFGRNLCSIAMEAQKLFRKNTGNKFISQPLSTREYNTNTARNYPKISIVTPSFNQGQFLEECIDSILSQNYPNLEYIIMDGGSRDNSVDIIKKYEKHLNYWQSKPDNGQYAAINEGFKKTTGEIMTWLNSDDILHPKSLDTVSEILSRFREIEWIMGRPNGIDEKGKQSWMLGFLPLWSREKYLRRQYKDPYIQQEGAFWRRRLWEQTGGALDTSWKLAADMELWARFFRFSQLHSVDALLGAYRTHAAQKTAALLEEYNREAEIIIDREIEFYERGIDKTLLPAPPPVKTDQLSPVADRTETVVMSGTADDKSSIRVSAIVSTYNSERFIRGCIEDLVNQTLYQKGELEIVVVNSGSGQNEEAVVREFQNKYINILYLRTQERETVYAAWNRGIKAASGRYITNANTDDRHRQDALELMAGVLDQKPGIGLVYADVLISETENETFEKHTPAGHFRWLDFDREKLSVGCFIGPQPMWKKSLHDEYGYFNETFTSSGDWEFWLRIAGGTDFLHIREFLGLYLRSPESLEHIDTGQRMEEDRMIYRTYIPRYLPAYEKYFTKLLTGLSDPVNAYRYGQILAALGKYDEAIKLYEAYSEKNPSSKRFLSLLQDMKTLKAFDVAPPAGPATALPAFVMDYINEADAHIAGGDLESAREAVRQAINYASGHPQLCCMLSNILENLQSPEAAAEFLGTKKKDG